ncbi:MAG: hypothetical protein K8R23_09025 [Chthoniobacter sp.]|nr:hypothetical protein [Chthoniobacter sp.]
MKPTHLLTLAFAPLSAFAGESDKKVVTPPAPAPDSWEYKLAMPGWLAGIKGDVGIGNQVSWVNVNVDKIIHRIDMTASFRGEVQKGRWGAQADFLYMSLSDGIGTDGLVSKLDFRMDQTATDFGVSYRLIEGPRGWVDVRGGFRYTNIFQRLTLHPDEDAIEDASGRLVDAAATLAGRALRNAVGQLVDAKLAALAGRAPTLPEGPLGGRVPEAVRTLIEARIDARKAELAAAIASNLQPRIDAAKAKLTKEIAKVLADKLDARYSRTDDWFDPYVGLRARYNFCEKFYFLAKADIGGFGVGSDLTWQASAAIGCQLSRNMFAEAGYRFLAVDYQQNGFTYDVRSQGAEVTLGITF